MIYSNRGGMQSSEGFSSLGIGVSHYALLKLFAENVDTVEPDRHP